LTLVCDFLAGPRVTIFAKRVKWLSNRRLTFVDELTIHVPLLRLDFLVWLQLHLFLQQLAYCRTQAGNVLFVCFFAFFFLLVKVAYSAV
jgi:hypothetical protein